MGHAGEQRAERAQLLALIDHLALALDFGLSRLSLRQIQDADHQAGRSVVVERARRQRNGDFSSVVVA